MTLTSIKPGLHAVGDLPLHPTLLHPRTGLPLQAIGFRRDGRAIWPQLGGDGTDPPADPPKDPPPPADPPKDPPANPPADPKDEPLGEGGKKALDAERTARKELEKRLAKLEPLEKLAQVLGGGSDTDKGKTEVEQIAERLAAQEKAITEERQERWRAEVRADKKLTEAQAARLVGSTKEELAKDADELLAAFGGVKPEEDGKGRQRRSGPRPDPGQGAREGEQASSLDSGKSLWAERHKNKKTTST